MLHAQNLALESSCSHRKAWGLDLTEPADDLSATIHRRRRARRFVLPDAVHDERTTERIIAFVEGNAGTGIRASKAHIRRERPRSSKSLDTRQDWMTAFQLEVARHARYGRPVAVVLLELAGLNGAPALDTDARVLMDVIRARARETDRAARFAPASFRVLMPETNARAARNAAARLDRAYRDLAGAAPGRASLRVEVAAPTRAGSLEEVVAEAEQRLAV